MERFEYKPIDLSKDVIRIIRLCRGYHTDIIRCELFEAYLDQIKGVSYEAVSYTWGNQSKEATILLDGKEALITSNLFAALSCLRLVGVDKTLWIDALCINQENDREKGHQVSRMKKIYEYAERVIIWLGPSNDDIDMLMESARELELRERGNANESLPQIWQSMMNRSRNFGTNFVSRRLAGLQELLRRAWFRRVWIVQEVAVAKSAEIRCGWRSVPTRIFALLPQLMEQAVDPHVQAVLDVMPGPLRSNPSSWWKKDRNLMSLLAKFRDSESKEPRDFVYALLGISSDFCESAILSPNYRLPLVELIRDVVWALLFREPLDRSRYTLPAWNKAKFLASLDHIFGAVVDWAISEGEFSVLLRLETCTSKVRFRDRMPLHSLIRVRPNPALVEEFLTRTKPDVNSMDEEGQTPLNLAVAGQQVSVFELLLAYEHIDVNQRNRDQSTPLNTAAACGNIHMFESLVRRHDIDIDHKDCRGDSPLNIAVIRGDERGVEVLLKRKVIDVNHVGSNGQTPLTSALSRQNFAIINMLLRHENTEVPNMSGPDPEALEEAIDSRDSVALSALIAVYWNEDKSSTVQEHRLSVALVQASAAGHLGAIRMLLEKGARVNKGYFAERAHCLAWSPISMPRTPLGAAITNGHEEATKLLLDSGASILVSDCEGAPPLVLAVKTLKLGIVRLLLQYGADIEEPDAYGQTPLCYAVSSKNSEMMRFLLNHGADVNRACSKTDGSTPLLFAVKQKYLSVVQLLLEYSVDVENRDTEGMTALTVSIKWGHSELVRALLDAGAKPDRIGQYNIVPLLAVLTRPYYFSRCSMRGPGVPSWRGQEVRWNPHTIAIVSMCGSNIQKERNGAQTVLSVAVTKGAQSLSNFLHSDDCEEKRNDILLLLSPNFNDSDVRLQDAEHTLEVSLEGLSNERSRVFRHLLHHKANLEARDIEGETLLWMAVCRAYTSLVEQLLEYGADVEAADEEYGMSPLWVAALLGFDDIIRLLLAKGANIERSCRHEQTPLSVAAEKGCTEAVQVLLAHGADQNVKNAQGRTPLEAAMENGHEDVVKILRASPMGMLGALINVCTLE